MIQRAEEIRLAVPAGTRITIYHPGAPVKRGPTTWWPFPMDISVIVCSWNRCQDLAEALESIAHSVLPDTVQWEILILDNNSTDQTRSMAQEFCRGHAPRFLYFFEPKQGKSHALNSGLRHARGEVIAFTDDDVVVERDWLDNLTAPIRDGICDGVGGRTFAYGGFSPPCWLPVENENGIAPFALFDRGSQPLDLAETPYGNNMAFRKDAFAKYGTFRANVGTHEDSDLGQRFLAAGMHLRYEPSAVVYHRVPANRIRKDYILRWWTAKARYSTRISGVAPPAAVGVGGVPLYLFLRLLRWTLQWMITLRPAQRFSCKIRVWSIATQISEYRRLHLGLQGQEHTVNRS